MGERASLFQIQNEERKIIGEIDKGAENNLQERMERLLSRTEEQFDDFRKNGNNKVWKLRNSDIIEYVRMAKEFLSAHGSSQIVEEKFNQGELKIDDFDDARLLAFCRVIEVNSGRNN